MMKKQPYNPCNKRLKLTRTTGCSLLVTLLLVFMIYTYSWVKYGGYFYILSRNDPGNVVTMFTLSLMQNKGKMAESLTVQGQWSQIDSFLISHQDVNCPIPFLDGDNLWLGGFNSSYDEKSNSYVYESSTVSLPCPNSPYIFSIKDITLQQTEKGWKISSWGRVCEAWGYEENDCFP